MLLELEGFGLEDLVISADDSLECAGFGLDSGVHFNGTELSL